MRIRRTLLSSVAIPLILAVPAFAQQPRGAAADRQLNRQDMSFVKGAAEGGLAEVEFGKLAQQQAQDAQVKQFGARMVQDHGSANAELTALASGKSVRKIWPSVANFLLVDFAHPDAVLEAARAAKLLIRDMRSVAPSSLRITVGTIEQNDRLIRSLT